jgi:hypothetical protein
MFQYLIHSCSHGKEAQRVVIGKEQVALPELTIWIGSK